MKLFWNCFWKLFAVFFVAAFILGIVIAFVKQSPDALYRFVQVEVAFALGLCGVIGFLIVPLELYFEERKGDRGVAE